MLEPLLQLKNCCFRIRRLDHTASGINGPFAFFMLILPAAALVLTAISIPLSVRMYQKKTI